MFVLLISYLCIYVGVCPTNGPVFLVPDNKLMKHWWQDNWQMKAEDAFRKTSNMNYVDIDPWRGQQTISRFKEYRHTQNGELWFLLRCLKQPSACIIKICLWNKVTGTKQALCSSIIQQQKQERSTNLILISHVS